MMDCPCSPMHMLDEGYKLRVAMKRAEAEVAWEKYNELMPPDTQFREYNSKEEFFANEFFIGV